MIYTCLHACMQRLGYDDPLPVVSANVSSAIFKYTINKCMAHIVIAAAVVVVVDDAASGVDAAVAATVVVPAC